MAEQRRLVTAAPENSETPLERLSSWVTPNRLFFVRNHFTVPEIDVARWRLRLEGCVERALEWSWAELAEMPQRTVFATVECAGNGRSFLSPQQSGVQWGAGAIGHAEWTGVPVRDLLAAVGLKPAALEVVFEGVDQGTEPDHPNTMNFARSLPLKKAMHPDTLLALRMNGEPLEPNHGFPLRLFVPGWYGIASVKWLRRLEVIDHPFGGYFQTKKYTIRQRTPAGLETVVVGAMALKSEFVRPRPDAVLNVGANQLFGVAWGGEETIGRVEVSTDGGSTWSEADLIGPRAAYSWSMWEYLWEVSEPGAYTLLARAISASGQVQPAQHDPLRAGYMINFSRPVPVRVEAVVRGYVQPRDNAALLFDMNAFAEENTRLPLDVELEFAGGEGI
jgi:DMSO/TMAO reductase YedYZ molybdopterin-dependent catalytic subunit